MNSRYTNRDRDCTLEIFHEISSRSRKAISSLTGIDNIILEDDIITWTMENYFDNESEKDKKHISAELYLKEQLEISFELGHF